MVVGTGLYSKAPATGAKHMPVGLGYSGAGPWGSNDEAEIRAKFSEKVDQIRRVFGNESRRITEDPFDDLSKDMYDLPDAFHGPNKTITLAMIRNITAAENWPTRELFPLERHTGPDTMMFEKIIFDDHLLDSTPEESSSRLVTSRTSSRAYSFSRKGKSAQMEWGFYQTTEGRWRWANEIRQIANATVDTADMEVIVALLAEKDYVAPGRQIETRGERSIEEITRDFQVEKDQFCVLQKSPDGLAVLENIADQQMMDRNGHKPDSVVLPNGARQYIKELAHSLPPGIHTSGGHKAGRKYYDSRSFFFQRGSPTQDFQYREVECGGVFVMNDLASRQYPVSQYTTEDLNTKIFNETSDTISLIDYVTALRASGIWRDFGTKAAALTDFGKKYFNLNFADLPKNADEDAKQAEKKINFLDTLTFESALRYAGNLERAVQKIALLTPVQRKEFQEKFEGAEAREKRIHDHVANIPRNLEIQRSLATTFLSYIRANHIENTQLTTDKNIEKFYQKLIAAAIEVAQKKPFGITDKEKGDAIITMAVHGLERALNTGKKQEEQTEVTDGELNRLFVALKGATATFPDSEKLLKSFIMITQQAYPTAGWHVSATHVTDINKEYNQAHEAANPSHPKRSDRSFMAEIEITTKEAQDLANVIEIEAQMRAQFTLTPGHIESIFAGVKVAGPQGAELYHWMLKNNVPVFIGLRCWRPSKRWNVGTALFLDGAGKTGKMLFAKPNFSVSSNANLKILLGHFTIYLNAMVTNPEFLYKARNVYSKGYIGGNGISFWDASSKQHPGMFKSRRQMFDIFSTAVPMNTPVPADHADMTGQYAQNERPSPQARDAIWYPSAGLYTALWGWRQKTAASREVGSYFLVDAPGRNTLCFLEYQQYFNSQQGLWNLHQLSREHWGERVYAGCGRVRRGIDRYLERPNYLDTNVTTLGY